MNYLTPSKVNQAEPLPLNSWSTLKYHLDTFKFFIIITDNLSMKSSLLLISKHPGAVNILIDWNSYLDIDFF